MHKVKIFRTLRTFLTFGLRIFASMMFLFLLTIWQSLEKWDRSAFITINSEWTNSFFDAVLPWLRSSAVWAPLYLFVFAFVLFNFKKTGWWWIVFFIVSVAITDMVGTYVFKHNFERLRPCRDPNMIPYVRLLLQDCAGGYSFTSNHAANHFGMATFFYVSFRRNFPKWAWIGFAWAVAIAYAQVYVGVHYPFDVLAGGLLGIISGLFTGYTFNKRFGFTIFEEQPIAGS
jgi:membrane-associated phospholipid phosphatase